MVFEAYPRFEQRTSGAVTFHGYVADVDARTLCTQQRSPPHPSVGPVCAKRCPPAHFDRNRGWSTSTGLPISITKGWGMIVSGTERTRNGKEHDLPLVR